MIPRRLLRSFRRWRISAVVSGSRAEVASSQRRTLVWHARALAMATRCFWPPLSSLGKACSLSVRPTSLRHSLALKEAFFV